MRFISLAVLLGLAQGAPVQAAPPFKSTDTGTAAKGVLEARLGLAQASRDGGDGDVLGPLLRANLGLGDNLELVTEFEYAQRRHETEHGAVGAKWRFYSNGAFSMGIETLALLPVQPGESGSGVEAQLLLSWGTGATRLHVNAGGFDEKQKNRGASGWRASVLAERRHGGFRHGAELFARQSGGQSTDVRVGYGFVRSIGSFDVRSGLHFGVTRAAPDVGFNLWLSRDFGI